MCSVGAARKDVIDSENCCCFFFLSFFLFFLFFFLGRWGGGVELKVKFHSWMMTHVYSHETDIDPHSDQFQLAFSLPRLLCVCPDCLLSVHMSVPAVQHGQNFHVGIIPDTNWESFQCLQDGGTPHEALYIGADVTVNAELDLSAKFLLDPYPSLDPSLPHLILLSLRLSLPCMPDWHNSACW